MFITGICIRTSAETSRIPDSQTIRTGIVPDWVRDNRPPLNASAEKGACRSLKEREEERCAEKHRALKRAKAQKSCQLRDA